MEKRKTVGQYVLEGQNQEASEIKAVELQKQMEKEYLEELVWCVKHEKREVDCSGLKGHEECYKKVKNSKDFFVEVIIKREMFLTNTMRSFFTARTTCPTPEFDQTVYRYDNSKDDLKYIWTVPDRESCDVYTTHKDEVPQEEQELLSNIEAFKDGSLLKIAKNYNKETAADGCALASEGKKLIKEK